MKTPTKLGLVLVPLACVGLALLVGSGLSLPTDEGEVAPVEAPVEAWYFAATVEPPVTPNGSAALTVGVFSSLGASTSQSPVFLDASVIMVPWDLSRENLGENPTETINRLLLEKGNLGWFQVSFSRAGEAARLSIPGRVVSEAGVVEEIVSVIVYQPASGGVLVLSADGGTGRLWASVAGVDQWVETSEKVIRAHG